MTPTHVNPEENPRRAAVFLPVPSAADLPPSRIDVKNQIGARMASLVCMDFRSAFEEDPLAAAEQLLELLLNERACETRVEFVREIELFRNRTESLGGYASWLPEEFLRELYWIANGQLLDAVNHEIKEPGRQLEAGRRLARLAHHTGALELARAALVEGPDVLEDLALENSSRLDLWLNEQVESGRIHTLLGSGAMQGDLNGRWLVGWRRMARDVPAGFAAANFAVAGAFDDACKQLADRWFLDARVIVDIHID